MPVTIDDCVSLLRDLKGVKVAPTPKKKITPSKYVLGRLVTVGCIDAPFTPATKAAEVQERDAILYWDNALCAQNPHLQPMITETRHREEMARLVDRRASGLLEIVFL